MGRKRKESKELIIQTNEDLAKTSLLKLQEAFKLPKRLAARLGYDMGISSEKLAVWLGTTRDYINTSVTLSRYNQNFQRKYAEFQLKLPEWYKTQHKATLPKLLEAERKAVDEYVKSPKLLIDKPALARQLRGVAGVSSGDDDKQQVVNVNIALQVQQHLEGILEDRIGAVHVERKVIPQIPGGPYDDDDEIEGGDAN